MGSLVRAECVPCPPIGHPRRCLRSLPWHACAHVRGVIGQELTVPVSHPNLLCALLFHELRVAVFYRCTRFHCFFGNKLQRAKNVRTTVNWLQIVALQKISRRKCDFFSFLSWQTIGFLEFLTNFSSIIMEERTKKIQHVNHIEH